MSTKKKMEGVAAAQAQMTIDLADILRPLVADTEKLVSKLKDYQAALPASAGATEALLSLIHI